MKDAIQREIKARFKPRDISKVCSRLKETCMNDKYYDFIFAYTLDDGSIYYEPIDKNFPSSIPVDLRDLAI